MAQNLDDIAINIIVNSGQATKGLDKVERALHRVEKRADRTIKRTNALGSMFRRIFGTYLGIQTIRNTMQTARELDLIERSIVGLTKSTQDWDYVQQEAFRTGNDIEVVAKGYRNFYSAATAAGFGKGNIQSMFSDFLTASRAMGVSTQATSNALLALEQMMSKGKISMEELRRQLGNALPSAFEVSAKAMGVTTQRLNEMVKEGLSANEFVPKFIAQLYEEYSKAFPEITKSMDFALKNLSNARKNLQHAFISEGVGSSFAQAISELSNLLRSPEFKDLIKGLGYIMSLLVKIFSFAIKHLNIILILLGSAGLAKILTSTWILSSKIMRLWKVIFAGKGLLAIKSITKALWAMNAPFIAMYSRILGIVSILLIVQDLLYGIVGYFRPDLGLRSITGMALEGDRGKHIRQLADSVKDPREALWNFGTQGAFLSPLGFMHGMWDFGSPIRDFVSNRRNQSAMNVNFNISSPYDPETIGNIVLTKMAGIFNGYTLSNGDALT